MKEQPKEITLCTLDVVLMPQGEIICLGKTVGWFKEFKDHLKPHVLFIDEHKEKHVALHKSLDLLVADMIANTNMLPSKTTVMQLMKWSNSQMDKPTEKKNAKV